MPELPEVEISRCGILPYVVNQTIQYVIVRTPQLRWPIPVSALNSLVKQQFTTVERRAKYLLFRSSQGTLILHLGMSGSLHILPVETPPQKHDHIDIAFVSGYCLRMRDPRRFGAILWTEQNPYTHPLLVGLGVEPLSSEFNADYLWQRSRHRKLAVKLLLMNSKVVVGIGNIYANEALFRAGVLPQRCSDSLTKTECEQIVTAVKKVLSEAIQMGGTTLQDFRQSNGKPGYFRIALQVYGREQLPCYQCDHLIQKIRLGQRSTFYCKQCQH